MWRRELGTKKGVNRHTLSDWHFRQNHSSVSGNSSTRNGGSKHMKWNERGQPSQHRNRPIPRHDEQKSWLGLMSATIPFKQYWLRARALSGTVRGCGTAFGTNHVVVQELLKDSQTRPGSRETDNTHDLLLISTLYRRLSQPRTFPL
jgi:hypothetical protein